MFCRRRCHAFAFARQIGVAFGPHGNRAIIVTAPRREDEVAEVAGVAREENRVAGPRIVQRRLQITTGRYTNRRWRVIADDDCGKDHREYRKKSRHFLICGGAPPPPPATARSFARGAESHRLSRSVTLAAGSLTPPPATAR